MRIGWSGAIGADPHGQSGRARRHAWRRHGDPRFLPRRIRGAPL